MTDEKSKPTCVARAEAIKLILKNMQALHWQKEKELRIIASAISYIKRECPHHIIKDDRYGGAVCSTCGSQFGWWCDRSPVHHCEYEMGEDCIHCGLPEERK